MVLSKENLLLQNSLSTPAFNGTDFQLSHIDIALLVSIHMNRLLNQKTNYTYLKIEAYFSRPPNLPGVERPP